ncbi:MAG: peptidase S41, partial [Synechococcaceae cyanobacterium RM1_1_27]|nr:peptidase S41 [Synechococcaceae cyanobacterium RM1_1_27]
EEDIERLSEDREIIATLEDPQYAEAVNALRPAIAAEQAGMSTSSL